MIRIPQLGIVGDARDVMEGLIDAWGNGPLPQGIRG